MKKYNGAKSTSLGKAAGIFGLTLLGGITSVMAGSIAEEHLACGIEEATHALYKKHPEIKKQQASFEKQAELNLLLFKNSPQKVMTNYTIPVVFHVIHGNGAENITDAQIQESVNQLNEDYNGNDVKKGDVFPEFTSSYANVGMSFVLARLDPTGQPTDGITRHYDPEETTQLNNSSDGQMKARYMWPRDKYLNIYVIRSAGGQAGSAWAFYPGQVDTKTPELDGVISSHWAIGRTGTATPTHHKNLTHEIGHWANLKHTFENYCKSPGDGVGDTPPTITADGCAKRWSPCSQGIVANSQNYMDYGYCTVMFTNGQSQRMMYAMNSSIAGRNKLYTQANLRATGVIGMPVNALFNIDNNKLHPGGSVTFNDVSESTGGSISSWQWSFPGGSPSSHNGQRPPAVTYNNVGTYSATLTVNSGGNTNTITKNDYITVSNDLVMRNDVVRSCSAKFYDSGANHAGTAGKYGNREDHKLVVLPNQPNSAISVNFNSFLLENNSNCDLDHLKVFDGIDENAPLIGSYCGNVSPGSVAATNSAGALTFVFHSNVKARTDGWDANISCTAGRGGGNIAPTVNANGPYNVKASVSTQFSSAGSNDIDGSIASYQWRFGDGGSSNQPDPSYAYSSVGTYNGSLTVVDNQGASSSQNFTTTVRSNQPDPLIVKANGPYSGMEGVAIDFSSAGTKDLDTAITGYSWSFGDGGTSTFSNPTYTYKTAGTYTTTLTVTNANNEVVSDTAAVTVSIDQGTAPPPIVDACATEAPVTGGELHSGKPVCVGAGSAVNFSISDTNKFRSIAITTSGGSGDLGLYFHNNTWPTPTSYTAKSTTAGNEECIYVRNSPHYWSYTSIQNSGGGSTIVVDFNTSGCRGTSVPPNTAPKANIIAPSSGNVDQVLSFDGSNSSDAEGPIATYSWKFGDGSTSTQASPSHSYRSGGTFNVSLTVADSEGLTNTASTTINIGSVTNKPPTAVVNGPYSGSVNSAISFSSAGSSDPEGSALTYDWNFGDGGRSTQANPAHTFSSQGTKNITLIVKDSAGLSHTATTTANVGGVVTGIVAKHNGPYTGSVNKSVSFSSAGSDSPDGGIVELEWDFGDGIGSSTQANPTYTYSTEGTFEVTLLVIDNIGAEAEAITTATIGTSTTNQPPTANAGGPYSGKVNSAISFNGSGSTDPEGTALTYSWKFGDGGTSNQANPSYAYKSQGTKNITLTVTDAGGLSHSATTTATVTPVGSNQPPTAVANGPYSGSVNNAISFSSAGSRDPEGSALTYDWNFGDGGRSTQANPAHTYSSQGTKKITLIVRDSAGLSHTATTTANVSGAVTGIVAKHNGPYTGSVNNPVRFSSAGSDSPDGGIVELEWDFGDGIGSSTQANPTYTYSTEGTFEVTLLVIDSIGAEAEAITTATIGTGTTNQPPTANAGGPYSGGVNSAITFNGSGSTDPEGTALTYSWNFGDGGTSNQVNPTHTYTTSGTKSVALTVTDAGSLSHTANTTVNVTSTTSTYCSASGGATTNSGGGLTLEHGECVNGSTAMQYYVLVPANGTELYIKTTGGSGDADIYFNGSAWASSTNYHYKSDLVGNEQVLRVTANSGYSYITLDTRSQFAEVDFVVLTTPPAGNPGGDTSQIGAPGHGTTDPNDPDCSLADTDPNSSVIRIYDFPPNNVTKNFYSSWFRVRGSAVDSNYQVKMCGPTYGNVKRGNGVDVQSPSHFGIEFEYDYKHFGARASNTDPFKVVVTSNGQKAVHTINLTLNNPIVDHPVRPSCADLSLDADMDGIPDCAEEPGKTFYNMPLYEWGARKGQMDLFVEVDWMDKHPLRDYDGNYVYDSNGAVIIDHGTDPKRKVFDRVKEIYAARGIHVHFDLGDKFDRSPGTNPANYDLGGGQAIPYMEYIHLARWTDNYKGRVINVPGMDKDVMPQYFYNNPERDHIFYYVLFANSQGGANRGSSGQAPDLFDRYMYISMGGTGWKFTDDTPENENMMINGHASTVVHELGHIFGLSHDGFPDDDPRNFKLNYPSAMNYMFQLQGGPTDKFTDIDYDLMVRERYYLSQNAKLKYACNPMLEATHPNNMTWGNLVHGLRSNPADFHIGYSDGKQPKIDETNTSEGLLGGVGLDHNCDGNIDNNVGNLDVNNDGQINFLWDYDDWGYLTFFFHYYNYDVKNEYDVHNEFLLEPSRHIREGRSPTDAKYPGAKRKDAQGMEIKNTLMSTSDLQKASNKLIGVEEIILPPEARKAMQDAMEESRRQHQNNQ